MERSLKIAQSRPNPQQRRNKMSDIGKSFWDRNGLNIMLAVWALIVIIICIATIMHGEQGPAAPLKPYEKANQTTLESAQPGDLIVCTVQNPVPPTTENVSKSGLVLHNMNIQRRSLGIILFDRMSHPPINISGGVKYSNFDDCEVSIVKDRAEQVKIIGEAVLDGSQQYMQ